MRALAITVLLALATTTVAADEVRWKVIVHPKNASTSIDRSLLRNAFLRKEETWGGGKTIRPIDLSSRYIVRDAFTREVLKKTPAQLKTYWSQQIFSGKGVPPPEARSIDDAIAYVLANPGAIGYIPDNVDPKGAKVIEVR